MLNLSISQNIGIKNLVLTFYLQQFYQDMNVCTSTCSISNWVLLHICLDRVTLVCQKLMFSMHETHEDDKAWDQKST